MLRSLLATLAAVLLLSAVPATLPVQASSAILRCKSPDGSLVYTDKACSAFGAEAAPLPGELLTRIYRDESRHGDAIDDTIGNAPAVVARRDPSLGCAHTPTQLAMDLRAAMALADVNRVAESYHWVGMSSRQGERTLDRLQALTGRPVLDSHYFDAQIGPALTADASTVASLDDGIGGDAGILQVLLGGDAPTAIDFDVHRYAGCYFVTF
ncbi:hypothetical protein [Cognatiluteimonas telluris]|uniref:hypothetical protein n=1 Tax=Cognatiluteimonas telluris TaxID=1104775 RepID=UPI001408F2F3|nr:hypothetical protein [Lysobacter telluris]